MKTVNFIQGTPEWHEHRSKHFNASDAPAMMGVSKYKTRQDLLREKATGIVKEVGFFSQKICDEGHRFESLARPEAANIIGSHIYPVTGTKGKFSASFDGITMLGDVIFEHKTLNKYIENSIESGEGVPIEYRVQMEHQLMVSGAEKCLFMASRWDDEGNLIKMLHVWYYPDSDLRQKIIDGWEQFDVDLSKYKPEPEEAVIKAEPIMSLPAIAVQVTGMVTSSNLDYYKQQADEFFANLPKAADLETDEDFANAKKLVKYCGDSEKTLSQTKKSIISQTDSIDKVIRLIDHMQQTFRAKRLELDKVTKARETQVKEHIIMQGFADFDSFVDELKEKNSCIAKYFNPARPDFASVCKGKMIKGHKEQVPLELARARAEAQKLADQLALKLDTIKEKTAGFEFLFNDTAAIIDKSIEDLRNLVELRISKFKEQEEKRKEQERKEQEMLANEQAAQKVVSVAEPPDIFSTPVKPSIDEYPKMISLGDINSRLGVTLSSLFLENLGYPATQSKASKLYKDGDFNAICDALIKHIESKKGN